MTSGLLSITIPHPIKLERQRGMLSLETNGRAIAVRLHHDDIKLLHTLCKEINIPPGSFMRWVIMYAAKELYKAYFNEDVIIRP